MMGHPHMWHGYFRISTIFDYSLACPIDRTLQYYSNPLSTWGVCVYLFRNICLARQFISQWFVLWSRKTGTLEKVIIENHTIQIPTLSSEVLDSDSQMPIDSTTYISVVWLHFSIKEWKRRRRPASQKYTNWCKFLALMNRIRLLYKTENTYDIQT